MKAQDRVGYMAYIFEVIELEKKTGYTDIGVQHIQELTSMLPLAEFSAGKRFKLRLIVSKEE